MHQRSRCNTTKTNPQRLYNSFHLNYLDKYAPYSSHVVFNVGLVAKEISTVRALHVLHRDAREALGEWQHEREFLSNYVSSNYIERMLQS